MCLYAVVPLQPSVTLNVTMVHALVLECAGNTYMCVAKEPVCLLIALIAAQRKFVIRISTTAILTFRIRMGSWNGCWNAVLILFHTDNSLIIIMSKGTAYSNGQVIIAPYTVHSVGLLGRYCTQQLMAMKGIHECDFPGNWRELLQWTTACYRLIGGGITGYSPKQSS